MNYNLFTVLFDIIKLTFVYCILNLSKYIKVQKNNFYMFIFNTSTSESYKKEEKFTCK
jgi:hypothetical protein